MALEGKWALRLDEMRLMPCHIPPHRHSPRLDSNLRMKLLELALADCKELQLEYCELKRPHLSYTVDSIDWLRRQQLRQNSITLLMGMDAFAQLTQWRQWWRLRELAHIAVVARPGYQYPLQKPLRQWLAAADEIDIVRQQRAGGIILLQQRLLDISATDIRAQLAEGRSPRYLLPERVLDYIESNNLYAAEIGDYLNTEAENL